MKNIFLAIVIAITSISTQAHAGAVNECAPDLRFFSDYSMNHDDSESITNQTHGEGDSIKVGFSISFKVGKAAKQACASSYANESALAQNKALTEFHKSQEYKGKADKLQAETDAKAYDNLIQKIAICADFTRDTAPESIKNFCGDLI